MLSDSNDNNLLLFKYSTGIIDEKVPPSSGDINDLGSPYHRTTHRSKAALYTGLNTQGVVNTWIYHMYYIFNTSIIVLYSHLLHLLLHILNINCLL